MKYQMYLNFALVLVMFIMMVIHADVPLLISFALMGINTIVMFAQDRMEGKK